MSLLPKDKRRLRGFVRRAARNYLADTAATLSIASDLTIHLSVVQEIGGGLDAWQGVRDLSPRLLALWRAEMRRLSDRTRRAPR